LKPLIKFRIESPLVAEYTWTLQVFGKYIGFDVEVVTEGQDVYVAEHGLGDIQVSHFFRNTYTSGDKQYHAFFRNEPLHFTASNKPDYLSTCFYLLSYLQEYADYFPDKYNRFPFEISLQKKYNIHHQNIVADYFDALYQNTPKLQLLVKKQVHKSAFFLSHDIDSIYGALGDNYKYLLSNFKLGTLLQLIFNHYLKTPDYLLLNKIMDIEDGYDVQSTFFWLVNQGKGTRSISNADYDFNDKKVQGAVLNIADRGWHNGLHKSAGKDTYISELLKLKPTSPVINRNHYLVTELPHTFDAIEHATIAIDATMGFPDEPGFRNSYGLPIHPFNFHTKTAYGFLEVPLNIMDTSLKFYKREDAQTATSSILAFLESNKTNTLMSVLWHNNYFFDYADKGWIDAYKTILQFIKHHEFEVLTPAGIIEKY